MQIIKTEIPGVVILEPRVFADPRGYFFEAFCERDFRRQVADVDFVQDNVSLSTRGVIRGLHFQRPPFAQAKLVSCLQGRVIDVGVDLRRSSPTFGRHVAVELSGENHRQLFLPRGIAHGFAVLSDSVLFHYKCDNYYAPASEAGISILDSSLGIDWQIDPAQAVLSEKDMKNPLFSDFDSPF